MAGWRKLPSPSTSAGSVPSAFISVRSCGSTHRKNPIGIPLGFPPKKRSADYARAVRLISQPNLPAWLILPWPESSDYGLEG